jgi:uncharacterized protein (UPF0179 family)
MKLTLVDSKVAHEGYEFVNYGEADECKSCKLQKACLNLESGRKYRVIEVRDREHDCPVAGKAKVVEVLECDINATLPKKKVFKGSKITFEPVECTNILCRSMKHCRPEGIETGAPYKIIDSVGKIKCEEGRDLVLVSLKKL